MTNQQHPLTPPPELVDQWVTEACPECRLTYDEFTGESVKILATRAAQWGADQELDACCEWLAEDHPYVSDDLRAARRPKPPSLAEEALAELASVATAFRIGYGGDLVCDAIRRALERLQELEEQQ